jgi:hypothetical protein
VKYTALLPKRGHFLVSRQPGFAGMQTRADSSDLFDLVAAEAKVSISSRKVREESLGSGVLTLLGQLARLLDSLLKQFGHSCILIEGIAFCSGEGVPAPPDALSSVNMIVTPERAMGISWLTTVPLT